MVALARSRRVQPQAADRRPPSRPTCSPGLRATPEAPAGEIFLRRRRLAVVRAHHRTAGILSDPLRDAHLARSRADIAKLIPQGAALVEFGSGSSKKARILLRALRAKLAAYVPVDICGEMIEQEAIELRPDFPGLKVLPVTADITHAVRAAGRGQGRAGARRIFPRLDHRQFRAARGGGLPAQCRRAFWAPGATLIVGADLIKPVEVLNAAYNDAAGVTAKFNLNLLMRINRELGGTFKLDTFEHHAFYNRERHRIEMHLASLKRQKVKVAGETIEFRAGETIHTENSYKYSVESLGALARGAGWQPVGGVDRRAPIFLDPGLHARPAPEPDGFPNRLASALSLAPHDTGRGRDFMKIVGFEANNGLRLGVVEGEHVIDLQAVDANLPGDLGEVLRREQWRSEAARRSRQDKRRPPRAARSPA